MNNVAGDEAESLSDIDDAEVCSLSDIDDAKANLFHLENDIYCVKYL